MLERVSWLYRPMENMHCRPEVEDVNRKDMIGVLYIFGMYQEGDVLILLTERDRIRGLEKLFWQWLFHRIAKESSRVARTDLLECGILLPGEN